jgi:hypothetical protein
MPRHAFAALMAGVVIAGAVVISALRTDVPVVSDVVRPAEAGTGTRCAAGDEKACQKLCQSLSDVSTIRCVDKLAEAFPRIEDGHRVQGGDAGGGPPGGEPPGPPGGGNNGSPPSPPKPDPPPEPPPNGSPLDRVCRIDPVLGRICRLIPGLIRGF